MFHQREVHFSASTNTGDVLFLLTMQMQVVAGVFMFYGSVLRDMGLLHMYLPLVPRLTI